MRNIEGGSVMPVAEITKASRKRKGDRGEGEGGRKRRKADSGSSDEESDGDEEMATDDGSSSPARRTESASSAESDDEVTPLSSPPIVGLSPSSKAVQNAAQQTPLEDTTKVSDLALNAGVSKEDEDDDIWVSTARRRARVAVLEDSDDE